MEKKPALRRRLRAARAARSPSQLLDAALGIARVGLAHCREAVTVAAYASVRDEPPTRELLDLLRDRGATVLLPIVQPDGLAWGRYEGWPALAEHNGLLEPPRASGGVSDADIVFVPALAVDHRGHRLGSGGGYYDRALVGVPRDHIVAVVFTDEVLDVVPVERHDVRVGAALTPDGVIEL